MKKGYTHIALVLDESTSMAKVRSETIEGTNLFIQKQKEVPGEATFTLVKFSTRVNPVYANKPLAEAPLLTPETYSPDGWTALLDAIGMTIDSVGAHLASLPEEARPEKVVFVIQTDGDENKSEVFTKADIDRKITEQRDVYKWEFIFLGANQDAIKTAHSLGISGNAALSYAHNGGGILRGMAAATESLTRYRDGTAATAFFTPEDRAEQRDLGATV